MGNSDLQNLYEEGADDDIDMQDNSMKNVFNLTTNQELNIPVYLTRSNIGTVNPGFISFVEDEGRIVFEDGN